MGDHRCDAGQCLGGGRIDGDDAGMRNTGALDAGHEHARLASVGQVFEFASDLGGTVGTDMPAVACLGPGEAEFACRRLVFGK